MSLEITKFLKFGLAYSTYKLPHLPSGYGYIESNFLVLQVRLGQILENGQVDTKMLAKHQGGVYQLALEPGSPHSFYSCGNDGFIQHVIQILDCKHKHKPKKRRENSNIGYLSCLDFPFLKDKT